MNPSHYLELWFSQTLVRRLLQTLQKRLFSVFGEGFFSSFEGEIFSTFGIYKVSVFTQFLDFSSGSFLNLWRVSYRGGRFRVVIKKESNHSSNQENS